MDNKKINLYTSIEIISFLGQEKESMNISVYFTFNPFLYRFVADIISS